MKRTVLIEGPVFSRSGYGDRTRDLVSSFKQHESEWEVFIFALGWGALPDNEKDEWISSKIINERHQPKSQVDLFIKIGLPNEMSRKGKYNILFTAGVETDLYPVEWINGMHQADKIIFSSEWVRTNFIKNREFEHQGQKQSYKLEREKTDVLFEGVDLNVYNSKYESDTHIDKIFSDTIKTKQNFLFIGHWTQGNLGHDRKDISGLIWTFLNSFIGYNKDKRPGLILKTGNLNSLGELERYVNMINEIKRMCLHRNKSSNMGDLPPVYLMYENLSKHQMNTLMNHPQVIAHISFTKGEGYGRPLLEAATTGKPLITTLNSGQDQFLKEELIIKVPSFVGPVDRSSVNQWIIEGSNWNHVNYEELIRSELLLKFLKEKHLYNNNADKLKKHIGQFSIENMRAELMNKLDKWIPKPIPIEEIELPDIEEL